MGSPKGFKILLSSTNNFEISFSASLANIDKAANEAQRLLVANGFETQWFNIILTVRETLTNAVLHGCQGDEEKSIKFAMHITDDHLIIDVEDTGSGFDWKTSLDKELPSTQPSGRGLSIMQKIFDTIIFNKKGNKIRLKKQIRNGDEIS